MNIERENKKTGWIIAGFILGIVVSSIAFYIFPTGVTRAADEGKTVISANLQGPSFIADVVDKTSPAVVLVSTMVPSRASYEDPFFNDPFFKQFFGDSIPRDREQRYIQGMGSGFIISKDGYILTNEHVVSGSTGIEIFMAGSDKAIPAKLVGSDYELDLAVLKISVEKALPFLELGDSDSVRVGEWTIAIGNPQGLDHTVTVGVISAKGRPITVDNKQYKNLLQTDASINPGNSGGPLINGRGQVIGINTAVSASGQGIGFAIPTSTVKPVLDTLINNGKITHPWLGIYIQPMNQEIASRYNFSVNTGALVTSLVDGGPAGRAGIIQGDIIVEINKVRISNTEDLTSLISKTKPGDRAQITVNRKGKSLKIPVIIAERAR
ncbi:MAG: PDZ domain-containing protein [Peptococcaceae bacterium]|nr:PDZ domain-containing protein [Peptococcaceae bacterium]